MFGPDEKEGGALGMQGTGSGGRLSHGEEGVGGVELQPPRPGGSRRWGGGNAGGGQSKGCCLWIHATGGFGPDSAVRLSF